MIEEFSYLAIGEFPLTHCGLYLYQWGFPILMIFIVFFLYYAGIISYLRQDSYIYSDDLAAQWDQVDSH